MMACKDLHELYISCFNVFLYFCTYYYNVVKVIKGIYNENR